MRIRQNPPSHASRLLLAVVMMAGGLVNVAEAQDKGPAVTILSRAVDFGAVHFDATDLSISRFSLLVRSSSPWALSVLRDVAPSAVIPDATPIGERDSLLVRDERSAYQRLLVGVPIAIATGGVTSAAGEMINIDLRLEPSFETATGTHVGQIRFLINGEIVRTAVPVAYSIAPVTKLLNEPEPFNSPLIDPTEASIYRFAPHTYVVKSNVNWVLEVSLASPPQMNGSSERLTSDSLVLLTDSGIQNLDGAGRRLVVASGGPTSAEGRAVELRLGLRIAGSEVGGTYSAEISVTPRAAQPSAY